MNIKITDNSDDVFKELQRKKELLETKTKLNQIFTENFVKENTTFNGYEDMMNKIQTVSSDFEITQELDDLINKNSVFSGFQEMYKAAAKSFIIQQLSEN